MVDAIIAMSLKHIHPAFMTLLQTFLFFFNWRVSLLIFSEDSLGN